MSELKVGLQVFSVREAMERDVAGTLKAIKEMGYDYVEWYGDSYGKTAQELAELFKEYDLQCISAHQLLAPILENTEETIRFLKMLGVKYSAIPGIGVSRYKGGEKHDVMLESVAKASEYLKDAGIQLLCHNHSWEYCKYEDKYLIDWLLEEATTDVIQPEFDVCWVHYAGVDPAEQIRKYAGHVDVIHLKDYVCTNLAEIPKNRQKDLEGNISELRKKDGLKLCPVGHGIVDFPAIVKAAEESGAKYMIVELDSSPMMPVMDALRLSREYLRTLASPNLL